LGTGFLVNKRIKGNIIHFQAISERMCKLGLKVKLGDKHKKISIVNIHAPTEEKEDEIKDEFYEQLEEIFDRIPNNNIKLIMGDANAKVGNEEIFKSITGGESKHDRSNDNGIRLINMAIEKQMRIMSTHFKRKDIYKGTWIIPGTNETNQIDHVLIEEKHAKMMKNVRTFRGADANSDHFLVIAKLKITQVDRIRTRKQIKDRYNMEELQGEVGRKYRNKIHELLESDRGNDQEQNMESKLTHIEQVIEKASKESLTTVTTTKRKKWLDEECMEEINKKKHLRRKYLQTGKEEDKWEYMKQRRNAKKVCRNKKRQHEENKIKAIEEKYNRQEIRNFYKDVKEIKKGHIQKPIYIKDEAGNLLGEESEIVQRWKQHFEELLKTNNEVDQQHEERKEDEDQQEKEGKENENKINAPTEAEIEDIIRKMKNNKSPGTNNITAEQLKYGGTTLKREITELIQEVWRTERMPEAWKNAVILPIHKKGDVSDCNNYRGIVLLDTMYKVLSTLIKIRLEAYSERVLGDYQCGFRKGRATTDQIFLLKQVLTHCYEYEINTFMLFIDFRAAYDSINREKLMRALEIFEIPEKLSKLVDMTLTQTKNIIRIDGKESDQFETFQGLRQGDPLSAMLFNMVLESIIRKSGINRKGTLLYKSHQCLAYADDVVLISRTKEDLKRIAEHFITAAK
jgi:Reverse transcriptase (RNA-dependent DNA polymerase)